MTPLLFERLVFRVLFTGGIFRMALTQINSVSVARSNSQASYADDDVTIVPDPASSPVPAGTARTSALARSVYCVLGIPIDAVSSATVVQRIEAAAANRTAFLISTPNLNFLVGSLSDPEFKESLLDSDLCPPDGVPIVWIARLLGLPIKERVAGSDLFDQLRTEAARTRQLTVFLFGGAKGVAKAAAERLNAKPSGLRCVGTMDPGFCEVSEMSQDHIIDTVNSSGADFLVLSLGAKKGQLWLQRNHDRLTIPIRAHLGAVVNFQAGLVKRAPSMVRAWGFEWLWRIKEEHYLWKRYRDDGLVLLRLLLTRVLPLAVIARWQRFTGKDQQDFVIETRHDGQSIVISLGGAALERHVPDATSCFQEALASKQNIIIDLTNIHLIDARFLGLLLMLRQELKNQGARLTLSGVPRAIKRIFRLNELGFLLSPSPHGQRFASRCPSSEG
jgi:N-acetylglucosaminyldiphosphoundecaprenol N-acetyl-beta-D-mannosaminyltransferase